MSRFLGKFLLHYIFILIYVVFLIGRLYLLFFEKCLFLSPSFNRIKPKVVKSQLETSTSILSGFKINQSKVCIRFIFFSYNDAKYLKSLSMFSGFCKYECIKSGCFRGWNSKYWQELSNIRCFSALVCII